MDWSKLLLEKANQEGLDTEQARQIAQNIRERDSSSTELSATAEALQYVSMGGLDAAIEQSNNHPNPCCRGALAQRINFIKGS